MDQNLLGQILLNFNLVSEDQLHRFLAAQSKNQSPRMLGEILVEEGILDESSLRSILTVQKRKLALDVDASRLTKEVLQERLQAAGIEDFLQVQRDAGASDLFLSVGSVPAMRLHGLLADLPTEPLTQSAFDRLCAPFLTAKQRATVEEGLSVDGILSFEGIGRFRYNMFHHLHGFAAVFRRLEDRPWPFEKLGLPDHVRRFTRFNQGLVLVTGPTGSGKTMTLSSLVDHINRNDSRHVVTIEDPIEIVHPSRQSLITQRQIHQHASSPAQALRGALREDPDVIVVGELRDPEMAATAITAAETGHLVFGTLHTASAYRTITRLVDQFPARKRAHVRSMLASVLRAVVCQQLVPNLDRGGRSLAYEILMVNSAVSNLIRDDRLWQIPMVMQMGASEGMVLMDDVLARLLSSKKICLEEAINRAAEPDRFLQPNGSVS